MIVVVGACGNAAPAPKLVQPAGPIASNVLRADYVGSGACADCHADIYKAWAVSPMRNMTRDAATAEIRAPFEGESLQVGSDTCTMTMDGANRVMRVTSPKGDHTFRITKVIGGRYRRGLRRRRRRQCSREPGFAAEGRWGGDRAGLPATYVFSTKTWRYKGYSVMVKERPLMSWQGEWSKECIGCHNTLPQATMLYDELYGPGLPAYQGKLSDRVLPPNKNWPTYLRNSDGMGKVLDAEIAYMGAPPAPGDTRSKLPAAAAAMEQHLDGKHLVELGVGCEACHNGARVHAADPTIVPAFEQRTPLFAVDPPKDNRGRGRSGSITPARSATRCCSRATRSPGKAGCGSRRRVGARSAPARVATTSSAAAPRRWRARRVTTRTPRIRRASCSRWRRRRAITSARRVIRPIRRTRRSRSTRTTRSVEQGPRASRVTWRRRTWGSTTC